MKRLSSSDSACRAVTDALRTGGDNPPDMPKRQAAAPEFVAASRDPKSWIELADKMPLTFRTKGQNRDVVMLPLSRIIEQRYGVYWRVTPKQA